MKHIYLPTVTVLVAVLFSACSLFKVSVSSGDPLPPQEAELRTITRGFYYEFQQQVTHAADSMAELSDDTQAKMRCIRWKMHATSAAASAAMQSAPEIAAIDMWLLCTSMNRTFTTLPDSLLFFEQTPIARQTAEALEKRYSELLARTMSPERFSLMNDFVSTHNQLFLLNKEPSPANSSIAWLDYLKAHGQDHTASAGSIPEAITEVGGKMEGYAQQFSNSLSWNKDLLGLQLREDSVYAKLSGTVDSLNRDFERVVLILEHFPEISDHMLESLNTQVNEMLQSFEQTVNGTFANIDYQRTEMQTYISEERKALMGDLQTVADQSIQQLTDAIPRLIGKVLGWIILFLVAAVGVPFALGFWTGHLYAGRKRKKQGANSPHTETTKEN